MGFMSQKLQQQQQFQHRPIAQYSKRARIKQTLSYNHHRRQCIIRVRSRTVLQSADGQNGGNTLHDHQSQQNQIQQSIPTSSTVLGSIKKSPTDIQKNHYTKHKNSSNNNNNNSQNPKHIAFICDGNSRWSTQNQHERNTNLFANNKVWGHFKGASNVMDIVDYVQESYKNSVQYMTFYAFSTENWSRNQNEIHNLWSVIETFCGKFVKKAIECHIKVKIVGDLDDDRISLSLRTALKKLEYDTHDAFQQWVDNEEQDNEGLTVCIAINYGGRNDIIQASLQLAELIARKEVIVDTNNRNVDKQKEMEAMFNKLLYTSNIPDPDLVIRTGGERRISNFLIWNIAYSELYFTDTLWPDYNFKELDDTIDWYRGRERRFGGRKDQQSKVLGMKMH